MREECLRGGWLPAHVHCQSGHVCGYVIASSNQMPVLNATHKQTNERTDWKRLNILRIRIKDISRHDLGYTCK